MMVPIGKPSLTVISPLESEHAEAIGELASRCFGGYYNARKTMRELNRSAVGQRHLGDLLMDTRYLASD